MPRRYRRRKSKTRKKRYYKKKGKNLSGYELYRFVQRFERGLAVVFVGITGLFLWGGWDLNPLFYYGAGGFGLLAGVFLFLCYRTYQFLNTYKNIQELRQMDPIEFERYTASFLEKYGFKTKLTPGSGDMGADIIVWKNRKKYIVQCKRYSGAKKVTSPEIQTFLGSMQIYKVEKGIYVATTQFTPPAQAIAKKHGIQLIDEFELGKRLKKVMK